MPFSDNAFYPFSPVGLDIVLNCDVPAREFLLPHLSFKDLFSLERTSKVLREKQVNSASNGGSGVFDNGYNVIKEFEIVRFKISSSV